MAKGLLVTHYDGDETLLNLDSGQHLRLMLTGGTNNSPILYWDNGLGWHAFVQIVTK